MEIRIMVKEAGKNAEVRTVKNEYKTFNQIVGGYLETMWYGMGVLAVFNEEGRRLCLPQNVRLGQHAILGTVFFCTVDGDGEFASLSLEQETFIKEQLHGK